MTQVLKMQLVRQVGTLPAAPYRAPEQFGADGVTPIYQEAGAAFASLSACVSGSTPGKEFVLVKNNDRKNNNITWMELLIATVDGAYPASPNYHIDPIHKIDCVFIHHHLGDVIIWATTHALVNNPDGSRNIYLERIKIPNIFV